MIDWMLIGRFIFSFIAGAALFMGIGCYAMWKDSPIANNWLYWAGVYWVIGAILTLIYFLV